MAALCSEGPCRSLHEIHLPSPSCVLVGMVGSAFPPCASFRFPECVLPSLPGLATVQGAGTAQGAACFREVRSSILRPLPSDRGSWSLEFETLLRAPQPGCPVRAFLHPPPDQAPPPHGQVIRACPPTQPPPRVPLPLSSVVRGARHSCRFAPSVGGEETRIASVKMS